MQRTIHEEDGPKYDDQCKEEPLPGSDGRSVHLDQKGGAEKRDAAEQEALISKGAAPPGETGVRNAPARAFSCGREPRSTNAVAERIHFHGFIVIDRDAAGEPVGYDHEHAGDALEDSDEALERFERRLSTDAQHRARQAVDGHYGRRRAAAAKSGGLATNELEVRNAI